LVQVLPKSKFKTELSGTMMNFAPRRQQLRFQVGTEVVCRTEDGWEPGRVVKLWYRDPDFPPGVSVPYQVALDDGALIFVPQDMDQLCRLRVRVWWEKLFASDRVGPKRVRQAIQEEGQPVDVADYAGNTALSEACRLGWCGVAVALLEARADANWEDARGSTPLHHAVRVKRNEAEETSAIVRALLAHGAYPNAQDEDLERDREFSSTSFKERDEHRTALHYCAAWGYDAAARALLKAAADPNIIDGQYKTPLHLAIDEQAPMEMVSLLLEGKADPDKGNIQIGMTSSYLMVAARNGDTELASALISARANLDIVGKQGMTPLHMAVRGRKENVVRLLVEARCDTSIRALGKTAGELACRNNALAITKLLGEGGGASADSSEGNLKQELYIK